MFLTSRLAIKTSYKCFPETRLQGQDLTDVSKLLIKLQSHFIIVCMICINDAFELLKGIFDKARLVVFLRVNMSWISVLNSFSITLPTTKKHLFLCGLIKNEPTTLPLKCRLQVFLVMYGTTQLWMPGLCLQSQIRQIGSIYSNMQRDRRWSECADFTPQCFVIDVRLIPADYLTSQLQKAKW